MEKKEFFVRKNGKKPIIPTKCEAKPRGTTKATAKLRHKSQFGVKNKTENKKFLNSFGLYWRLVFRGFRSRRQRDHFPSRRPVKAKVAVMLAVRVVVLVHGQTRGDGLGGRGLGAGAAGARGEEVVLGIVDQRSDGGPGAHRTAGWPAAAAAEEGIHPRSGGGVGRGTPAGDQRHGLVVLEEGRVAFWKNYKT